MNAIDLFAGAGGLSIALKQSGFDILMANEINPRFAETHSYNFPDVPLIQKDINEVTIKDLRNVIGDREVDLIVGGPPCQGFSVFESVDLLIHKNMILIRIRGTFWFISI